MAADIELTFGKRLRQARKMRGLSLAALREKMGSLVSIAALSKYEKGQSMASSKVLVSLSEALDVSLDYLFREFEVKLDRIRFRKLSTLPKKQQESVTEQARDFFERYFEIEKLLGAEKKFRIPDLRDYESDYEKMAEKLREDWKIGLDPISNVHDLLEENGIKVWLARKCDDKFNGLSAESDFGQVIVVSENMTAARRRMTALHELAHILCEPLKMKEKEEEKFVRAFTGALLLPKEALFGAFGRKRRGIAMGELLEIKKRFGCSMAGIMMRARQLGIVSKGSREQFFRRSTREGWRKLEPFDRELSKAFPEESHRFKQLVFRAYGEDLITLSQASTYLGCSMDEANSLVNDPFLSSV